MKPYLYILAALILTIELVHSRSNPGAPVMCVQEQGVCIGLGDRPNHLYLINGTVLYEIIGWVNWSFLVSQDKRYLVTTKEVKIGSAIAFYENGTLMKEYTVSDLINEPEKMWINKKKWSCCGNIQWFKNDTNLVEIEVENEQVVFDITTGERL